MITRIWRGRVPVTKAEPYLELMRTIAIPDYEGTAGNKGAWCLYRTLGDVTEVVMLSMWENRAAIESFAGADVDRAKYYDFDADYLLDFPERVEHYSVLGPELRG